MANYGVCLSPAQESAPGNDGDIPAETAGITRILHTRYGFSHRRSFEHRGIIILVMDTSHMEIVADL